MSTDRRAPTRRDNIVTEQAKRANFDCVVEQQEHAVVVSASGAIDLATQTTFAEKVHEALHRQPTSVVIDLAGVTFLASPGLAVLVEAQEKAMRLRKKLHIAVGSAAVKRSIDVTGLGQILSLVPDVGAALRLESGAL
ncbi:STAS domain-containing protein [Kibdelosporangium philippinense]|uniref:Anti-sigma factor antagonist n=1 Tax=Kibdelosporangium philippinense TaxID=211113 RepID=A0ABS8ZR34_9PSEU|nr:STAS domain-containing protein [Kibdelosporangium philippinense]MCE7010201.1 STAS domain-containing protein [Kibdelosporangium philippinense]